jgi:tetratricopeptide (TPR) repeat protein
MTSNPFAERYLYLASVGFCWILGWAGVQTWNSLSAHNSRWRATLAVAVGLIASLAAVRIVYRNRDWRDSITFYTATLKISPDAYYIHNNLGTIYWAMGDITAAKKEWITALHLAPASEFVLHNLGLAANSEKNYSQAEAFFRRALAIRPNYMDAHLDLGKTYEATGKLKEAEIEMLTAENLAPLSVRAHVSLSEFFFDQRQMDKAEAEARLSVEIEPTPQGEWDLGLAEWVMGNRGGAERAFLGAEALNPSSSRAHFMLGLFYMDSGRNPDAIREYRAGLQIEPANADAVANFKKLEFLEPQHE